MLFKYLRSSRTKFGQLSDVG